MCAEGECTETRKQRRQTQRSSKKQRREKKEEVDLEYIVKRL